MKYKFTDYDDNENFSAVQEIDAGPEKKQSFHYALGLLLTTMALIVFGLTMLYSASSGAGSKAAVFFNNQLMWSVAGTLAGSIACIVGYRFLAKNSILWIIGVSGLLVWAACSRSINGARRWIHLGGYTFQPSEIAKIVVALFVAWYCAENLRTFNNIKSKHGIVPLGAGVGVIVGLVAAGEDLGTTSLICFMVFMTLVTAGLKWYYWCFALGGATGIYVWIRYFDSMRWLRMIVFLDPELHRADNGYQLWNGIMALGSGGWTGVGLMKSRLKANYLPEAHTDFILAVTGEELGFVGICTVLLLYVLWGFFALQIAFRSRDRMGLLAGWALTVGIIVQALINIGAMSGCFPTKGMPAPFISYGGSNLLGCLIATGVLLSIAIENDMPDYSRNLWNRVKNLFNFSVRGGAGE